MGPGWMWLNAISLANHPAKKTSHVSSMVFHILEKLTCKLNPKNFNHCPKFDLPLSVFGKIRGYIFYMSLKISKYCQQMLTDIYSKLYYKSYCYGSRFKISICVIDLVKESISFFLFKNITFLQPDTLLNRPAFRLMGESPLPPKLA